MLGATAVGVRSGGHAHVAEQVQALARGGPPEVGDRLADANGGVDVVADAAAVAGVGRVRHAEGVHRDVRVDLRQQRRHLGRIEFVGQRDLDALTRVGAQHQRAGTETAAGGRVACVAVGRGADDRRVPVLDCGLVALQHEHHAFGIAVGEMREPVGSVHRATEIVRPPGVGDEHVGRRDVIDAHGVAGFTGGESGNSGSGRTGGGGHDEQAGDETGDCRPASDTDGASHVTPSVAEGADRKREGGQGGDDEEGERGDGSTIS